MPDEDPSTRLPPFPDHLVELRDKYRAIAFLDTLQLPPHVATKHLRRWAEYTEVALEAADYRALETFRKRHTPPINTAE